MKTMASNFLTPQDRWGIVSHTNKKTPKPTTDYICKYKSTLWISLILSTVIFAEPGVTHLKKKSLLPKEQHYSLAVHILISDWNDGFES